MLLRAYFPKFITALFGGLFIATGILTFGNAMVFDYLFLCILIFTAIICRKDINVVGIVTILLITQFVSELLWLTFVEHFYNNGFMKIIVYFLLGYTVYKFWYDSMTKIALICLTFSILAELYWIYAGYQNIPGIYWSNILITISLLTRYMLFSRVELTETLFKKPADSINLDWFIYQITKLYIIIEALNILEFLLRHVAKFPQLQVIYTIYPYTIQFLATFTLFIVFNETNRLVKSRLLGA
jgi:hypothetical protein